MFGETPVTQCNNVTQVECSLASGLIEIKFGGQFFMTKPLDYIKHKPGGNLRSSRCQLLKKRFYFQNFGEKNLGNKISIREHRKKKRASGTT